MTTATRIAWREATWNPVTGCPHVQVHPERLTQPLRWRKPRQVSVSRVSDLFHITVSDAFLDQVWLIMLLVERHQYHLYTQHAARLQAYLAGYPWKRIARLAEAQYGWHCGAGDRWFPEHVWLWVPYYQEEQQ